MTRSWLLRIALAAVALLAAAIVAVIAVASCGDGSGDDVAQGGFPAAGEHDFRAASASLRIALAPEGVSRAGPDLQETETIELRGSIRITRGEPQVDADGRIFVETEITSLGLDGEGTFGSIKLTESPTRDSSGDVHQRVAGQDFPADGFFDLFVDIEIELLDFAAENEEPLRLAGTLTALPEGQGDAYRSAGSQPIYTATGLEVGSIIELVLVPNPPPATPEPPPPTQPPDPTRTPRPTATPVPPPAEREMRVRQSLGCVHSDPGVRSDLLDLVLLAFVGAERVAGATVDARIEGPGVIDSTASAVTDETGVAGLTAGIDSGGEYTVTITSVTFAGGTQAVLLSADSQTSASFTVEAQCTPPEPFPGE